MLLKTTMMLNKRCIVSLAAQSFYGPFGPFPCGLRLVCPHGNNRKGPNLLQRSAQIGGHFVSLRLIAIRGTGCPAPPLLRRTSSARNTGRESPPELDFKSSDVRAPIKRKYPDPGDRFACKPISGSAKPAPRPLDCSTSSPRRCRCGGWLWDCFACLFFGEKWGTLSSAFYCCFCGQQAL